MQRLLMALGSVVLCLWAASVGADGGAAVGATAPDFTLNDAHGQPRSLAEFKGAFIALEWFNPECPFVRKHYGTGNMQALQHELTKQGAIWLSINSSALDKQGHLTAETAQAFIRDQKSAATAVLLDPTGEVGQRYGAKTTPHMFLIDPAGTLIYAGAIDDRPSADPADIPGATNYIRQALLEAQRGQPVSFPETKSYGCSVKY